MTNTYNDNWKVEERAVEELRLIRCCLERLLRHFAPENFVDYEMEKFTDSPKLKEEILEKIKKAGGFCAYLRSLGEFNEVEIKEEKS